MNYTQLTFSNHEFTKERKTISKIVLDSKNFYKYRNTEDSDSESTINFIKDNLKAGLFYDYVISREGVIFKVTSEGYASNALDFNLYSEKASKFFPTECPQTDGAVIKHTTTPDVKCVTILTETDNVDGTLDTGDMTSETKDALEYLMAYLFKTESLKPSDVMNRFDFSQKENDSLGHMLYKNDFVKLVILTNTAKKIAEERSSLTLDLSSTESITL